MGVGLKLDVIATTTMGQTSDKIADLGINLGEFDVLAALRRTGKPYALTPSALISQNLVTSGTMTNRLDRLEELQLITREQDPDDGRGSLVTLTKSGMRAVDAALESLLENERELLGSLTAKDRELLADLLSKLVTEFDEN